ncbi:MAG TPA: response regulator transcription factor [Candidatus Limnocylindrales bacterium]|nr:response regulator transcription factor [Candidatus Limnocylindrales bacterium]
MSPTSIVLVDDHPVVREGLGLVLGQQPDLVVVGEAWDIASAVDLAGRFEPDVVVMDIALGSEDAVSAIGPIVARAPRTKVLVLTMFHDAETVRQCLLAGAAGFVVKGARGSDVVDAIRAVARGERYIHSAVAGLVVEDSLRWLRDGAALSPREREVLSLLGGGHSPAGIGETLGISVHTVRRHLANAAAKLDVHGLPGLVGYARKHGLARTSRPTRSLAADGPS